jgi:hypothetical protein
MHRREFLHPSRYVQAAGQLLGAVGAPTDLAPEHEPQQDTGAALIRFARRCMATTFEVVLPFGTPGALEIGQTVFDRLDTLESQLTVYRQTSEVSHLNRLAQFQAVPNSRPFKSSAGCSNCSDWQNLSRKRRKAPLT